MRLGVIGCILAVSLTAGCVTTREDLIARKRHGAMQEWKRQGHAYRSSEGFQDARWGMRIEEVRELFPNGRMLNENAMRWTTRIADLPAVVTLSFLDGRFVAVDVFFPDVRSVRNSHLLIRRLLNRKYGTPVRDRDTADEAQRRVGSYRSAADSVYVLGKAMQAISGVPQDQYTQQRIDTRAENDEAEARREARAASKRFLLLSRWATLESDVKLRSVRTPEIDAAVIEYESARYAVELAAARRRAQEIDLQRMTKDL
ncbi:hypothetical protein NR800_35630 [Corallococcus interemptor]|uniref:hypothetical protein n=1 Tax=Corallococcus interemptor TaxID=2316720 RepID=UPI0035D42655